ncbi:retention module-containing protein [Paenalcaligenes sp. Me52]|uniref:retention module-containing protein n=1 Tax=Paenalcaligenes sp. Me52 TaxID=3392038 RepID=UPI003D29CEB9
MDTVLVGKVAGNAWVRQADGSLLQLREGMRVPANAEVVTDSGASVQLQGDGMEPITLGENRQLQVSDDMANNDVDPSAQTVPAQMDPAAARVLAALQAGEDPFEQLDPTAAVNSGAGGDDGGSSFTRLASIIEPTTPLALAYPKPIRPEEELPRLAGYGRNNDPEYTLPADLELKQVNNDSETVVDLNVGQYFSDPDGHPLTFTATGLPPGLTIDPNTGVISGTLDRSASQGGQGGVYTVVVTAKDPYGGSVDLPFTWTALNPPPEAADDHGTTEENTVLEVPKDKGLLSNDVDPDGDDLVVTGIENADGLSVAPGTPIPGSNGGTLVVKPDGSYTFTPGTDFDYLAEGETTTVEFEYTISDGEGGTDKAKLVITITGTNDAPVISGAGTDGEGTVVEIEDNAPGEGVADLIAKGKITFTDVDASDSHTATLTANPEAGQDFLGELTLGAIDPATKELAWEFKVNDADVDHLAAGETLVQKYTVTISDGKGGVTTQEIVITIVGTNDAPVIDASNTEATGTVTEIGDNEPGENVADLTTGGKIAFTDVDVTDSHTATLTDNPEAGQDFLGELTLGPIDPATKELTWSFTVNDADIDYLAAGETLVQKYTVTIADGKGGFATQEIVVTIVGTNDAPVIDASGTDDSGRVVEIGDKQPGENIDDLTASGKITFTDTDANDTHTATVSENPEAGQDFLGELTLGPIDPVTKELTWTYTVNDADVDHLAAGETLEQKYTVTISDGKGGSITQEIVVTIVGTNDAPIMSGVVEGAVTEDGSLTTGGQLTKEDVDLKDTHEWYFDGTKGTTESAGNHGKFTIDQNGKWTYELNNDDPKVQALGEGETLTETIEVTVDDGNGGTDKKTITVTINGTNDAPVIDASGTDDSGRVVEIGDKQPGENIDDLTTSGKITFTDTDANDTHTATVSENPEAGQDFLGELTLGPIDPVTKELTWTYTVNDADVDHLAAGETLEQKYTVTISDGKGGSITQEIVVTIVGTNDAPIMSGVVEGAVTEDGSLTTGGQLTKEDVDLKDTHEWYFDGTKGTTESAGNHGKFTIDQNGKWTYELNNDDPKVQALGEGETLTETIEVTVDDGNGGTDKKTITVTINGTNDAPVIDASGTDDSGRVVEIGDKQPGENIDDLTTGGKIKFTDTDANDTHTATVSENPEAGQDFLGELTLGPIDPVTKELTWTYTVNDADVDHLAAGETLEQKYTVTISDGKGGSITQEIVVTIVGTNDAPIMSGVVEGAVTEDGPLTTGGQLTKEDVDLKDTHEWYFDGTKGTTESAGNHGKFTIDQNGKWTYELNNDDPKVQALGEGETLTETIEVTVDDGNGGTDKKTITVTINGTNDAPETTAAVGDVVESGVKADGSKDPNAEFKGTQTATGDLIKDHVTDVDANDTLTIVGASLDGKEGTKGSDGSITVDGIYGTLVIHADGTYTYTLDNTRKATQSLTSSDKVKEVFNYTASDGKASSSSTLTINVQGTNDRPEISDKSVLGGEVIEAGHDQDGKPVAGESSVSGVLVGTDVDSGHTEQLTWHLQKDGSVLEGTTQTIKTEYGTLTLNSETGLWTYKLDNDSKATQALGLGDKHEEKFEVLVRDPEGAWNKETITVVINGTNDAPTVKDQTVNFDEDPKEGVNHNSKVGNVLDGSENPEGGELTVISFTVGGKTYTDGDVGKAVPVTVDGKEVGTFVINKDGSYEFTPKPNYSGEVPPITYVVQEPNNGKETGLTAEGKLTFTINPVADAPEYTAEKPAVKVNEDEWVALGLKAPKVTDDVDHNGAGAGDNPELLGAITLRDLPLGSVLKLSDGTTITMTKDGAIVTDPSGKETNIGGDAGILKVVLTDGSHISGLDDPSYLKITSEQFESMQVQPPAETGANFTVRTEVTSYEVDDNGKPLPNVPGATTHADVKVEVQAVTDPIKLEIGNDSTPPGKALTMEVTEDRPLNLKDYLKVSFPENYEDGRSGDGNGKGDFDGSEERWFEVTGLPEGSVIVSGGTTYKADANGMIKVPANGLSTSPDKVPDMHVKLPKDFSGDVKATVTFVAQDRDPDATDAKGAREESSIDLTLFVNPEAGDVWAPDVTTKEDTAVAFMAGLKVTDDNSDAPAGHGEHITAITVNGIPAGWIVKDANGNEVALTKNGDTFSFEVPKDVVDAEGWGGYTVLPPAHSSKDANITLQVTSKDTNVVNGVEKDSTVTKDLPVHIKVTPVAEEIGKDSDGNQGRDLTMASGHGAGEGYSSNIAVNEDAWFDLNQGGIRLGTEWSNEDGKEVGGSEDTYGLFTPVLVNGADGETAAGATFRYSTDGGNTWVEVVYDGEHPVAIPVEYLGTLQFRAPEDVSGEFKIGFQAQTVDYDEDNDGGYDVAVSGQEWLNGIVVKPVADGIQSIGVNPAHGNEDSGIPLFINPTSKDPSETFNVKIADLPDGSTLTYNGQPVTIVNGVATINNFDSSKPLVFTPPKDASGKFDLKVQAQTEDKWGGYESKSEWSAGKTLSVDVKGVADMPTLVLKPTTYEEGALDGHGSATPGAIALKDFVTAELADTDGSETLSFKISGLPDGFWVEGATFSGGEGEQRVWTFTAEQLQNVKIHTPEHFSGNLPGLLTAIATEKDGHSTSITKPFDGAIVVTPTPEANPSLNGGATFDEDTRGNLDFTLQIPANGDDNEEVSAVYLDMAQLAQFAQEGGLQLFIDGKPIADSGLDVEVIDGKSYYKIPQDLLGKVTAEAGANFAHNDGGSFKLNIKFDVIDHSNDGKLTSKPVQSDGEYAITVTPVTDKLSGEWTAADPDNSLVLSNNGETKVGVTLTKQDDTDGSEQLTQFVINGVPDGVVVNGIEIGGQVIGSATLVGPGKWVVTLSNDERPSFGADGKLNVNVIFDVKGDVVGVKDQPLTVTGISQDKGAHNTESASVGGKVTVEGTGGPGVEIIDLDVTRNPNFEATEDTPFKLGELLNVELGLPAGQPTADYSIVLTTPVGTEFEVPAGVEIFRASVDGDGNEVWIIKSTGTPQDLNDLLGQIVVTPPQDFNSQKGGDFSIDATVNVVLPSGKQGSGEVQMDDIPVAPQTDKAAVSVDFYTVDEGKESGPQEGKDLGVTITVTNVVDSFILVGDTVLLKADVDGTFTFNGEVLSKDQDGNWILPLTDDQKAGLSQGESLEFDLVFTPDAPLKGGKEISLDVTVQTKEQGATAADGTEQWVDSTGSGKETIEIVNNGYEVTVGKQEVEGGNFIVNGKEVANDAPKGAITLDITGKGLLDADEEVHSVRLDNLPNDFLVYYTDASGKAVLATNADGMWTIPTVNGKVPEISILPPKHWSGTLTDLELTVLSGEKSLKDKDQNESSAKFDLVVAPVADGIASLEAAAAFGAEGSIVKLNLNLTMHDRADATVKDKDGNVLAQDSSQETVSLKLDGLGEHAAFYTMDADGKWVLLSEDQIERGEDGSYVLSGLTQEQVLNLGLVQSGSAVDQNGKVTIEAWTQDGDSVSDRVTGEFDINLSSQKATADSDNLLFDGKTLLDGGAGDDTVWLRFGEDIDFGQYGETGQPENLFKNIETFDLTREGFDHSIENLSVKDVLDMTDSRNVLTIRADHGDKITLGDGWVKDDSKSAADKIAFKGADGKGELIIESTDAELLKAVADSLKDKGI